MEKERHLNKCPHCGGEAHVSDYSDDPRVGTRYAVWCSRCNIHTLWYSDKDKAIDIWNRSFKGDEKARRDQYVIVGTRNSGKTLNLLKRASEDDGYIMVSNEDEARWLFGFAQKCGINIRYPITCKENLVAIKQWGIPVYIDNADRVLATVFGMYFEGMTIDREKCVVSDGDEIMFNTNSFKERVELVRSKLCLHSGDEERNTILFAYSKGLETAENIVDGLSCDEKTVQMRCEEISRRIQNGFEPHGLFINEGQSEYSMRIESLMDTLKKETD